MRWNIRPHLEHNLRVPRQPDARRRAGPPPAADKHGYAGAARGPERPNSDTGERLPPRPEQLTQHNASASADQHHPGRLERHQIPVTARAGNPPQMFELDQDTSIHPFKNEWVIGPQRQGGAGPGPTQRRCSRGAPAAVALATTLC